MENTNREPYKVCYFPSLSAGAYSNSIRKSDEIAPGITVRFWDDTTPVEWQHKYFLLTAGHLYKKPTVRQDWGLNDTLVFGDSGGFQIASGAMVWDVNKREQIFNWLETNSDIACNIDIPPRATYEGRFAEALDLSIDNFKYFENNQTGKTKFLNVIQGSNPVEFDRWYNKVKDFEFGGWCFGSSRKLADFMYILALMLREKEFDKKNNTWIHVLGISKVSDFLLLSQLQKLLNKYTDNRIRVSTDSSSPTLYPVYGRMIWDVDWKTQTFNLIHFAKDPNGYNLPGHVPSLLDHPGVPYLTWDIIKNYSTEAVKRLTYHNVHAYVNAMKTAETLIDNFSYDNLNSFMPDDVLQVLRSMEEMFEAADPVHVYEKYRSLYFNFGGGTLMLGSKDTASEFFDFSGFNNFDETELNELKKSLGKKIRKNNSRQQRYSK
jgi:hypothetical protein